MPRPVMSPPEAMAATAPDFLKIIVALTARYGGLVVTQADINAAPDGGYLEIKTDMTGTYHVNIVVPGNNTISA